MHVTYPTETGSTPTLDESSDRIIHLDHEPCARVDTSDDPTGAALAWPFVMFLVYVGLALAFVVAR